MANKIKIIKPLVKSAIKAQNKTALKIGPKVVPSILSAPQQTIGVQFWKNPIELSVNPIVSRPISMAERLGIPKSMRSNPKALEDPYYWGYKEWNNRYNAAIKSGNIKEVQRLRNLHFKIKASDTKVVNENDMPLEVYHFTSNPGIKKFRPSLGKYTSIIWFTSDPAGKGIYYPYDAMESQDKLRTYLNLKTPGVEIYREDPVFSWDTNDFYKTFRISPLKKERADALQKRLSSVDRKIVDAYENKDTPLYNKLEAEQNYLESNLFRRPYQTLSGKQWQIFDLNLPPQKYLYDAMIESGADGLIHNVGNTKHYLSFDPTQIKLSDPITYDDNGNIISIVKRDNFHNPDMRYKQGGIIKGQDGIPEINGGELQPVIVKPAPVKIVLRTDPITKHTPITHSSLRAPDFFVSKGSDDPTYNFLKANCSDATGEVLELFTGQDFTSGITTPIGVSRKVRKIYGSKPGYSERKMTSRYQEFEVPWYDYRRAKDLINYNTLQTILNKYNPKPNVKANIIANWAKERPTLPYYLDEDNNVHYYKE